MVIAQRSADPISTTPKASLKWLSLFLIATMVLVGCQPQTEVTPSNPWLSTMPRESAMVMANDKPLTDQQIMRLWNTVVPSLAWLDRAFNPPWLGQGIRWLESFDDVDDMRTLGINPNGYWAGHADNDQMIFYVPLGNAARFEAWWADSGAVSMATMTIEPTVTNREPDQDTAWARIVWPLPQGWGLSSQLGSVVDEPKTTWSADSWSALNQKHRLDGHLTVALNPRLFKVQPTDNNPDCQALWHEWTAQLPEWIIGTQDLTPQSLSWLVRMVRHDESVNSRPMVDVSSAIQAGVAGFGLAMGATELRAQILDQVSRLDGLDANCRSDDWGLAARRWTQALANRPLPPVVTSIQGLISRYEGHRLHEQSLNSTHNGLGDYFTEVYLSNPQFMIGLAQLFSADMAAMDFSPGQPPKRLPITLTDQLTDQPVYLSTTERSIRLSADPASIPLTDGDRAIENPNDQTHPWMVASLNLSRLNELDLVLGSNALASAILPWLAQLDDWGRASDTEKAWISVTRNPEGLDLVMTIQGPNDPD